MKKYTFLFSLLFCMQMLYGQDAPHACGADELYAANVQRFPWLAEARAGVESFTQQWIEENTFKIKERNVMKVPVVVHILWHDPSENLSDLQIKSQIDVLNLDFRMLNADKAIVPDDFQDVMADAGIEFALASVDPRGGYTSGITRTYTEYEYIGSEKNNFESRPRICYDDLGGKDAWDTSKYLNIWVGRMRGAVIGKGCKPGECLPEEDGIFIDPLFFGSTCNTIAPFNLGRIITHEVGHYLNLFHLWGPELQNCESDDFVEDTPGQLGPNFGCPQHPVESCGSNDMYMNFMDYADDECMAMFTQGQVLRMRAALEGPRSGLLSSRGISVARPEDNRFTVFPNPAEDCVHLDVDLEAEQDVAFMIVSTTGKVMRKSVTHPGNIMSLNTAAWEIGTYYFYIKANDKTFKQKLIIQRPN